VSPPPPVEALPAFDAPSGRAGIAGRSLRHVRTRMVPAALAIRDGSTGGLLYARRKPAARIVDPHEGCIMKRSGRRSRGKLLRPLFEWILLAGSLLAGFGVIG